MARLISFLVICLCFYIFFKTYWVWYINYARKKGLYPPKGKATMFDVRDLIMRGERELAVRLYCEIFSTNYKAAKKAVGDLEKNIQEKNSEFE